MKHNLLLAISNKEPEDPNECAKRLYEFLRSIGCDNISTFGYTFFKDFAENYRATKIMRRGKRWYAYFGKTYVRYGE